MASLTILTVATTLLLPLTQAAPHGSSSWATHEQPAPLLRARSVPGFQGPQSGIGSWYQADTSRDSTNGKSWCGFTYTDSDPLFAPDLATMGGATYSSNPTAWKQQTDMYCGLEANVTDPKTGKSMLMYIGDGFDPKWVKSPGSIDIMLGAFTQLNGDPNQDKDIVINPVQWVLTGNQNPKYMAPGATPASGNGGNGGSGSSSGSGSKSSPSAKAQGSPSPAYGGSSPPAYTGGSSSGGDDDCSGNAGQGQGSDGGYDAVPTTTKAAKKHKATQPATKGEDDC